MIMRKTKHWLVTAALLLCSISVSAHDFEVDGIYYNITSSTDLTVEVTYQGSSYSTYADEYSGEVVIPTTVTYGGNTYSVTSIGNYAFDGCANLTSVIVPEGVVAIGSSAFWNCSGLVSMVLPKGISSIPSYAFYNCSSLSTMSIPEGVTSIGSSAFNGCSGLTSVVIPKGVISIGSSAFDDCSSLVSVELPQGISAIASYTFYGCSNLVSINIPEGVVSIGRTAFRDCNSLKSITLPVSLEEIEDAAFFNCFGLSSITIPTNVASIGNGVFDYCSGLTSIVVADDNTIYDSRNGCNAIIETDKNELVQGCKNTKIPESVTSIGERAFRGCSYLFSINIPEGVTLIGSSAFYDCRNLKSIVIPATVVSIGDYAISGCLYLKEVSILGELAKIERCVFSRCTSLASITLPSSIVSIGESAFYNCKKLNSIIIPKNVTSIGGSAFKDCTSLTSITCESEIPPKCEGDNTFSNVNKNIPLYVPAVSVAAYQTAEQWGDFTYIQQIPEVNMTLPDGENFLQPESEECDNIFYTRTFNNTNWQALYVPFEVPYDNIKDDFEVAYINDTRQYDRDDDGVKEETVIEAFKITSGTLEANYPYLIRAKEAGEKTITVTDAILYATEENSIDCSSVYDKYTFTGTYSRMSSTELTGCYALSGGVWQPIAEGATLGAFRFYLQVESRSGSAQAAQSIKMRVIGEETDDEATSIDEVESADNEQIVYDLAGRRVANPTKGVYIVNGKKMLYN